MTCDEIIEELKANAFEKYKANVVKMGIPEEYSMQKEKDFGMRLMQRDFCSGLWKRHKDYRHTARAGCDTYVRAFKIMCIEYNKIYSKPR